MRLNLNLIKAYHFPPTDEASSSAVATPEKACTVQIAEWIYSRVNPGKSAELVPGVLLDWPVPTVQRLWFG